MVGFSGLVICLFDANVNEIKFYLQIVRGVHFIHNQGVLHLDLKPFNIMFANVQDDYNLRIIDFGLAEQLEEGRDDVFMSMCGTLEYMSPEVMDCKHASRASGENIEKCVLCALYPLFHFP